MKQLTAAQIRKLTLMEAMVDVFKDDISFTDLLRTLPFAASFGEGDTKTHIVSEHAFNVPLYNQKRFVTEGETLCGRQGALYGALSNLPACPGCHAIGQGIVARGLMADFPAEYFEAKQKGKK